MASSWWLQCERRASRFQSDSSMANNWRTRCPRFTARAVGAKEDRVESISPNIFPTSTQGGRHILYHQRLHRASRISVSVTLHLFELRCVRVFCIQSDDSFGGFAVFSQMSRLSNFSVFSRTIFVCGGFTVFGQMICSAVFVRLIRSMNLMSSVGLYSYGGFILFSFGSFARRVSSQKIHLTSFCVQSDGRFGGFPVFSLLIRLASFLSSVWWLIWRVCCPQSADSFCEFSGFKSGGFAVTWHVLFFTSCDVWRWCDSVFWR